mmetsp:Transcript_46691/g.129935  ORF Transcript_46691/g.129935 Transcript_46691/m.129935 type:complete len:110 (-) Transcript_46691:8-337(-)
MAFLVAARELAVPACPPHAAQAAEIGSAFQHRVAKLFRGVARICRPVVPLPSGPLASCRRVASGRDKEQPGQGAELHSPAAWQATVTRGSLGKGQGFILELPPTQAKIA